MQFRGGEDEAAATMVGKIQALGQMDGGAVSEKKFFTKFIRMVNQLNYLNDYTDEDFNHKKMYKKTCRRVTKRRARMGRFASIIDDKKNDDKE